MDWSRFRNNPGTPLWKSRGVVALAAIGTVALAAMLTILLRKPAVEPAAETQRALAVSGFKLDVAGPDTNEFDGSFAIGKVASIPAGMEFSLAMLPAAARGTFDEFPGPQSWQRFGGTLSADGARFKGRAPTQPGLYRLEYSAASAVAPLPASATTAPVAKPVADCVIEFLVLSRAESEVRGDRTFLKVNGKSIGGYHDPKDAPVKRVREHAAQYQPPKFFAMLDAASIPLRFGPDFDLGTLVAFKDRMGPDGKKIYTTERHTDVVPLRPDLIDKLIKLRERLRQKGVAVTRFGITSAFRTPDYNKSIGGAMYSRHCYGDAVDLYIDEDQNHKMDDLNGDGRIDRKDGLIVANACRELEVEGSVVPGGIGVYEWHGDESVRSHVHIDCRGYISRWGQIESGKNKKTFKWWPPEEFQDEDGE